MYTIGDMLQRRGMAGMFVIIDVLDYSVTLYACNTGQTIGCSIGNIREFFISL